MLKGQLTTLPDNLVSLLCTLILLWNWERVEKKLLKEYEINVFRDSISWNDPPGCCLKSTRML